MTAKTGSMFHVTNVTTTITLENVDFAYASDDILFCGKSIPFNIGTELVSIGAMFGFLKDWQGQVAISNRIFEIYLTSFV